MFIPIHDEANAIRHIRLPYVTWAIIAINVVVWAAINALPEAREMAVVLAYAFKPDGLPEAASGLPMTGWIPPDPIAAVTSVFLHEDFWHLLGNMAFLWVFGDNVEDAMGHWKFLAFYVAAGVAGALVQSFATPGFVIYGASGAVSGVIVAYLLFHPHVRLWILVLMRYPLKVPALWVIAAWIVFQVYNVVVDDGSGGVGWWAHLAGIAVGAILTPVLRRPGVPLFDRPTR